MVDSFSLPSGLKINFEKFEVLFLANGQKPKKETVISLAAIETSQSKKLLVQFSNVQVLWRKLKF